MAALSLISLNIERSKNLSLVLPFLASRGPEVACIQELMEPDIPRLAEALGATWHAYVPMTRYLREGEEAKQGIGIFSRLPIRESRTRYYRGDAAALAQFDMTTALSKWSTEHGILLAADVEKEGSVFRIITTHFTWTPDGQPDDLQRKDLSAMLPFLDEEKEFALCGDFNAPRGGEIFSALASRYADTIPPHYKTSLDLERHRAGKTKPEELADKMVDGLFTTPSYSASGVELVSGVSDHCAVVASLEIEPEAEGR